MNRTVIVAVAFAFLVTSSWFTAADERPQSSGWRTNTSRRSVDLADFVSGGPPKDGIPSIDRPKFVGPDEAARWLGPNAPVIAVEEGGEARAYPLEILVWHEIVNDTIGDVPVAVTFCPLCYSAIVFDRRVGSRTLVFGVSGMLRHSDLVMFDRETESWWQQMTGEALVGEMTGTALSRIPAQIVGFSDFASAFQGSRVLSRDTGFVRDYGRNPYSGYDDTRRTPFAYEGPADPRLRPMERVVAVEVDGQSKAYPYTTTSKRHVIADRIGKQDLVVFHIEGAVSALDAAVIASSRETGSTGVFDPLLEGRRLTFRFERGRIIDTATGSRWTILGQATDGPLKGRRLRRLEHGDYFAFAWLAFKPKTEIFGEPAGVRP